MQLLIICSDREVNAIPALTNVFKHHRTITEAITGVLGHGFTVTGDGLMSLFSAVRGLLDARRQRGQMDIFVFRGRISGSPLATFRFRSAVELRASVAAFVTEQALTETDHRVVGPSQQESFWPSGWQRLVAIIRQSLL